MTFLKYSSEKKNTLIAEKYVQAGIYLTKNENDSAKKIFEEIILSKNKFYSILALNTIIEKELIVNKKKILEYFNILEKSISSKDQADLIILKKGLYLIKNSDIREGENLLNKLINSKSSLKPIAQELLDK